jgi:alpha-N-acetylglucosamine transferase
MEAETEAYILDLVERWNRILATKTIKQLVTKDPEMIKLMESFTSMVVYQMSQYSEAAIIPAVLILGAFFQQEGLIDIGERVVH